MNTRRHDRGPGRGRCLVLAVMGSVMLWGIAAHTLVAAPPMWINLSDSAPRGLYRRLPQRALSHASYMVFPIPERVNDLTASWGWPAGGLLIKPVGAVPGDRVCMVGGNVWVNTERVAAQLHHDRAGRVLPRVRGCFRLRQDEFLPLATRHPRSFDGRYFGAVPRDAIIAVVTPLWIIDHRKGSNHDAN